MAGCGSTSLLESKKIDYKSAGKLPPLEIPPDLTSPTADNRFAVPDVSPQGSATLSVYNKERAGQPQTTAATSNLLPSQDKVRVERAGSQRWLVVNATPEQIWPVAKEFWQENGFLIKLEVPESGVMETDWAENRAKIPQDAIRSVLSKVMDGLYSTAERDKFRTRLERGAEQGTTEIYISHRGMYEVIEGGDGGNRTVWQPRPADPELEADMLRRLMVRFGVDEVRSQAMMVADGKRERAKVTRTQEGAGSLTVFDTFDRAWRRVGLALDRVGFTVVDRDRSKGLYFVRYVDPDIDGKKDEKGFMSKLAFWKSDSKNQDKLEQYRIQVMATSEGSAVNILNKDGAVDNSETATRILNLLLEQLK
ncbi:MAG: outer membrane protein assembly factor BamC [Gammaproteobacteria bacterium]|nr:outer membrane protein assembly factor BamC [Gammaproteobacteria bacterium]MBU1980583.1 outer membrane protein assembly factor BamC [Gammaproteobacteria bacterium]